MTQSNLTYTLIGRQTVLLLLVLLTACTKKEDPVLPITFLGGTLNSAVLMDGATNVEPTVTIALTFSSRLDPAGFEQALNWQAADGTVIDPAIQYTGGSSRVELSATLERNTTYALTVAAGAIGRNGEELADDLSWSFTTVGDEIITEQAPCASASGDCLETISVNGSTIEVYRSFPLTAENRRWERLRHAIIVVHGQQRNADDYFQNMTTVLQQTDLSEETILLAPRFAGQGSASELFWTDRSWRIGANADNGSGISSFSAVDELMAFLGDAERFPVLEDVLISGHSSGGAFTHLYAVANTLDEDYPDLTIRYVVANSQYFYYPEDVRWDEETQAFVPINRASCPDYDEWPYGLSDVPDYLLGRERTMLNDAFAGKSVTYLLGTNDVVTTGSLNTRDCAAVLLGEHRYRRGQLMHQLMETYYPDTERHDRLDVPDMGHNAVDMYQSGEFRDWLSATFE